MTLKRYFLTLFICCSAIVVNAQNTQKAFTAFARHQDSLFIKAYNQRDVKTYHVLLDTFLNRYNRLSTDEQKNFKVSHINAYYNLCCTYSLLNNKKEALDYFDKSIKAGYYDYNHIQKDSDLDNIRNEKRFKNQLLFIRGIGDYRYILTKAAKYNPADKRPIPVFTYQSADNPHLVALRNAFKLDSVAGTGNDASRIINLLHWMHDLIPHNGNLFNPDVRNAMSLIAVCKQENRGLNCRGLATVLNECYLSLGYKSRFVTCMPKDSLKMDNDCHVINMVYVPSLKKWIWIDPTNDAYVMDEAGTLLSIAEVRERVINNKPLIVNPDANWNHKSSVIKEEYLFNYMAKNLYLIECPLSSEYDTETPVKGKTVTYVDLLPLDYFKQLPNKDEHTNTKKETTTVVYKTNNADVFWQLPAASSTAKL